MCEMNYAEIENQIGYTFTNRELLKQAFTRRSYSQEHGGENNEVLEFYGDKVLEFIVGKLFSEWFGKIQEHNRQQTRNGILIINRFEPDGEYHSDYNEGKLTEFRKLLVSRQTLAQRIYDLDLEPYLQLGKGDEKNGVRDKDSVKEDLFEAILGAVAIDSKWDIKKMQDAVEVMLCPGQFLFDENHVEDITRWTIDEYGCVPKTCFDCYRHPYLLLSAPSRYFNAYCDCYLTLGEYRYSFHGEIMYSGLRTNISKRKACSIPSKTKSKNQANQWQSISLKYLRAGIILICPSINIRKVMTKTAIRNGK